MVYKWVKMSANSGKLIGEFVALRGYPNEQKAMQLLRETASLVKPIMQKHGWRVPVLMELWENPTWNTRSEITLGFLHLRSSDTPPPLSLSDTLTIHANISGYNEGSGKVIALRLRRPEDRGSFYPMEELVHTMLHE